MQNPIKKAQEIPLKILQIEQAIATLGYELTKKKRALAAEDAAIEEAIATNESLKNDQQRRAAKAKARTSDLYTEIEQSIEDREQEIARKTAELHYWRNNLSILKLEAELAIATLKATA